MKEYNKQYIYKNFNRNNKWLGIIDYKSLMFLVVYVIVVVTILRIVKLNIEYSIYIFLFLTVPVVSVIFININNEVAIDVIFIIIKYYTRKMIYTNLGYLKEYKKIIYKKLN